MSRFNPKSFNPKTLLIAAAAIATSATAACASGSYWVVGNLVTNSCGIVSQSPVVNPSGPVWFGNGPYKSYDDARQARAGISACPRTDDATSR